MGIQEEYWEHIEGKVIIAMEAEPSYPHISGRASFDWLRFYVEGYSLSLTVNEDTDEIVVTIALASEPPQNDLQTVKALQSLVGKEFFWLWMAENSQGYRDTLMMSTADPASDGAESLGPVVPEIAFVGIASSIQVFRLLAADD